MVAADLALTHSRYNQITLAGVAVRLWLIVSAAVAIAVF
jgi:hypothetical protein